MTAKYAAAGLQFLIVTALTVSNKYALADYGVYKVLVSYFPYMVLGQASIYTIDLAQSFSKDKLFPNLSILIISSIIIAALALMFWHYLRIDYEFWMAGAGIAAMIRVAGMLALADARILEKIHFINC